MSFEVVPRGAFLKAALPAGHCSLTASANLRFREPDLAAAGIRERVVVLVDRDNGRIALRAPRAGEESIAVAVGRKGAKAADGLVSVGVPKALRLLGMDARGRRGHRPIVRKEDLLIVNLNEPGVERGAKS